MKQPLIGIAIVVVAVIVGVGAAFGVSRLLPTTDEVAQLQITRVGKTLPDWDRQTSRGMMGRQGYGGMMPGYGYNNEISPNTTRLTLDEVQVKADAYAASVGANLKVVEVMEFSNNFYVVVQETDSGKAAFELLVDPYTGSINPEMGANRMWNQKYGMMGLTSNPSPTNLITMTDAAAKAQAALDAQGSGAVVMPDGKDFYGYYSFDYEVNGTVAGMLSVNGDTGQVLFHSWHTTFVSEKEFN
jgi:hypothetical protein